jgi:hypothetical protein
MKIARIESFVIRVPYQHGGPYWTVGDAFQGGSFCSLEYDGAPLDRILKDAQR